MSSVAQLDVKDAHGATIQVEAIPVSGRAAAAASKPNVLSTEDKAAVDAITTAINALIALLPTALVGGKLSVDVAGVATEATLSSILAGTPSVGSKAISASAPIALPNGLAIAGTAQTAINTNLLTGNTGDWTDAANFRGVSFQVVGGATITAGAIIFEQTNDTSLDNTGVPLATEEITSLTPTPAIAGFNITSGQKRIFAAKVVCRYVRVRISTGFTGAATGVTCTAFFSQLDYSRMVQTVAQATGANLNFTPTGTTAVGGVAASGASVSGNPVRVGLRGVTATYVVTTGQTVDQQATLNGSAITKAFSIPELDFAVPDSISNSTTAAQIKAALASNKNYVTELSLSSVTLTGATILLLRSTPVASTTATLSASTLVMAATYNWKVGDMVLVTASGVTGLTAGSYYYILTVAGTNLTFSATRGGATASISGTSVNATLSKVMWKHTLPTVATPLIQFQFPTPLDGGTGLAIEMCTPTASGGGAIEFNVAGYQAA